MIKCVGIEEFVSKRGALINAISTPNLPLNSTSFEDSLFLVRNNRNIKRCFIVCDSKSFALLLNEAGYKDKAYEVITALVDIRDSISKEMRRRKLDGLERHRVYEQKELELTEKL